MQNTIIRQQILKIIGTQPQLVEQANQMLAAVEQDEDFDLEGIDEFIAALESTLTAPESYPQVLQQLIAEDLIDEGDLPEQFDRGMIISLLAALYTLESRVQSKPQGFSRGGLAEAAKEIQSKGRDGDTILAHINPQEARLLKAAGGSGTINPETGLPEFKFKKFLKKLVKVALPIALAVFAPGIGTAIGSAIGLSGTAASVAGNALLQGTISKASGGDFVQGAIGGAIGGGLGGVAGSAANNALNLGLGATGQQILGGAITGGLQGAATGGNVLQGALGGALGSGLGNLAGAGLNETLGLGLGDVGTRMLGSGLSGAAMSAATGGDALKGGLSGALGGLQMDNPFASALSGAAQSKLMGGDVAQGAIQGGFAGLANKYREELNKPEPTGLAALASSYLPGYKPRGAGEDQQYIPFGQPQSMDGFDPTTAGLMDMNISASPRTAGGPNAPRFEPMRPGTFTVAPNEQVERFRSTAPVGSMERAAGLPVQTLPKGVNNYVSEFIKSAEAGYMNPMWATYRPGVQIMASQQPATGWGGTEAGTAAYVPRREYPGTADTVMLVDGSRYTPSQAASLLTHELAHVKQPLNVLQEGSFNFRKDFGKDITAALPHLQQTYGYRGAYDKNPSAAGADMIERMADLQSFQFNRGVDFAKDPVFQQVLQKDPLRAAIYNANTIERTTRLDPRDLPPGVLTSSDFPRGQVPLRYQAQDAYRRLMNPGRRVNYAKGGLAEMADASRPYIGYRSAGRRPESQQDRTASANAPLAALRGMVSGALGAPGDIESLVRMLPGLNERTVLPTSEDVRGRLPGRSLESTPVGRAATELGTLGGGFYVGPGSPLRAIAALPSAVSRAGRDFAMASGQPAVNVVKPKGGNWLAGSVERAIEPMRPRGPTHRDEALMIGGDFARLADTPEGIQQMASNEAIGNWLNSKLAKYIRNEMATPEDPLRALADRGVTHIPEGLEGLDRATWWVPETLESRRKAAGFPREGMSETRYGQGWEQLADQAIHNMPARMRVDPDSGGGSMIALQTEKDNPWLMKVPPDTMTYGAYPVEVRSELGFEHLVDELKNAISPASGLPENLRWKYSDLDKVTVPQAVERVAKINDWRAAQKAEADLARAMNPATQVVKEYPDQGFKWVELRQPKETGKKVGVERPEMNLPPGFDERQAREWAMDMADDEGLVEGTREYNQFVQNLMDDVKRTEKVDVDESYKALEDALKYEGETMGHCVGGYCPDVVEGRSRIYSLRDKKGQPHVTIEVAPYGRGVLSGEDLNKMEPGLFQKFLDQRYTEGGTDNMQEWLRTTRPELANMERIVQIKGKGNKAPKEEYLPAVQDFIRSGNWSEVGDLGNTGLIDLRDPNSVLRALIKVSPERDLNKGIDNFNQAVQARPKGPQYMTLEELRDFLGGPPPAEGFSRGGAVRGYAEGGMVSDANFPTDDFDPDRIDAIVAELHAMNAA